MSGAGRVRLDRLLANLGYGSRKEVQALIAAGLVLVDRRPSPDPGLKLELEVGLRARVTVAGEPLDRPAPLTLVMHKPLGLVCSHEGNGQSVYDLLPARWRRRRPVLSTIGRLDKDTTGLLLITDDGALLHMVISPRRNIPKRYRASLARPLGGFEAALFASGDLVLDKESTPLAPARLETLTPTTVRLTIVEGRYHQVRRMFAVTGNLVTTLHRERIGSFDLPPDLDAGEWRILHDHERARMLQQG